MSGETTTESDSTTVRRGRSTPSEGERSAEQPTCDRSADQPTRAGLKGAGRSRSLQSSERPRATGGFLGILCRTPDHTRGPDNDTSPRAQTSIDFVVGAGVFLLTVAFVVAFLPGVFQPFTASGSGDVLAADRTAGLLAEQLLADPTEPGVLDADCTAEFFDAEGDGAGGVAGCGFSTDAADLDAALGLGATTAANVTIEENGTVRSVGGERLAAGGAPPDGQSVVVSRRVVMLDGEESDLVVRVW